MKILFMGTPDIAVSMLKQILADGYDVIGVVTQPDKKAGRKQELKMSEVKQCALQHNIPVYQPVRIKDDYKDLMMLGADLIVTCAYGQFIPSELLEAPTYGSINVHASLLPKLRGGAPIHKAIIYGEKETGMSIMRMVKAMDAGAVMAQCKVRIEETDTAGSLYDKLAEAGAKLLSESIVKIKEGKAVFVEQQEEKATFAYTISKEEEFISFDRDISKVYDHIRGLIPFPVGHGIINNKKVKFHKVRKVEKAIYSKPGEVLGLLDGGFAIAAVNGYVLIDEIQMEGKAKTDAKAFFNGAGKQLVGQCFL
ncbi:methionyl-tRNA formyltransferase [Amedibacterium intestinale]|jgi:methionyl-tRNA formyltransferase|uniref:methionyl-tRNA formyltransferase n=1 Tax=Amedibacterium intestinale TaxID=2583452 RepID=UPI00137466BF|nr:methionyl-tRNA formyltransferase [Amedibacterium intestinale]BBK61926.1 methionyl-tRNA formyltransferase [Amedibacterium intestinale]